MAGIEPAPAVADDFYRVLDHLAEYDAPYAPARTEEILQGIAVLEYNPLVDRPARDQTRELITGSKSRGYVTLYRYVPEIDTVLCWR